VGGHQAADGGLAVLLDGPQGGVGGPAALGVSVAARPAGLSLVPIRAWPTAGLALWPCPGAGRQDGGCRRGACSSGSLSGCGSPRREWGPAAGWRRILDLGQPERCSWLALRPIRSRGRVCNHKPTNLCPVARPWRSAGGGSYWAPSMRFKKHCCSLGVSRGPERLGPGVG